MMTLSLSVSLCLSLFSLSSLPSSRQGLHKYYYMIDVPKVPSRAFSLTSPSRKSTEIPRLTLLIKLKKELRHPQPTLTILLPCLAYLPHPIHPRQAATTLCSTQPKPKQTTSRKAQVLYSTSTTNHLSILTTQHNTIHNNNNNSVPRLARPPVPHPQRD